MIELKLILEQIIKEVGDLDKIPTYPIQNNSFITDEGWKVDVEFQEWDEASMKAANINTDIYKPPIYNVSYTVEGVGTQFTKSNYGSLVKILKTVVTICEYFVKETQPNGIIIFAANKDEKKLFSITDLSKTKIYYAIAIKYIFKNLPNYVLVNVKLADRFEGFMIYNKEKINK